MIERVPGRGRSARSPAPRLAWRSVDPGLRRALSPLSWAVWRRYAVTVAAIALLVCAGVLLVVIGVSRVLALPAAGRILLAGFLAVGGMAGLFLLRRPWPADVARAGDRAGLKQRLVTALELGLQDGMLARAQREDAVRALKAGGWRTALRILWPGALLWTALGLSAVAALVFLFIPDRGQELARVRGRVQAEARQQADMVAKAAAALSQAGTATPDKTREQAAQALRKLEEQLRQASGGQEAMVDLTEATRQLEQLVDVPRVRQGRALAELGSALASSDRARQAGEALSRHDWASAQRGIEAMADQLEQQAKNSAEGPSQAEREALARMLAEGARKVGADTPLGRALQQAARDLMSGRSQDAAQSLRELAQLAAQAGRAADSQAALANLLRQLQAAQTSVAAAQGAQGQSPQGRTTQRESQQKPGANQSLNTTAVRGNDPQDPFAGGNRAPGEGEGQGQTQDQGDGQGGSEALTSAGQQSLQALGMLAVPGQGQGGTELPGFGQGDGSGQGDGQGNGEGGLGQGAGNQAGTQSTDQISAGNLTTGPGQSQTGEPPRNYRNFEPIYAPTRLGGSSSPDYLSGGALGEGAGQAVETDSSPMGTPGLRPYSQVYAEYAQKAREGLERAELPAAYRDSVKKYFSNLTPDGSTR